ncbi:hypothetical protein CNMCM8927_000226 [Aspergillus lentulus]|uniref:Thioredoxin domain-containing protein n=1 Tax=Aspergillus lentulus TaxID=293939 RepID=A0AAN5YKM9_ASPLE|nr:hypothetical protein CNMCM8060_007376 [Aspergillus lentulus]KAF4202414.1 hypothetical protein CNMCM8927_000226 [Aspergillus lentulus]
MSEARHLLQPFNPPLVDRFRYSHYANIMQRYISGLLGLAMTGHVTANSATPPAPSHTTTTPSTTTNATILQLPFPPPYRFSMASGSISELMAYVATFLRKVEHSIEPVVVTFLSPLEDKCQAVASKIEELSGEFTAIKFYQVDVRKHTMLSTALSNTELPIVVFVNNGRDILTLTSDVSRSSVREGLQALKTASC